MITRDQYLEALEIIDQYHRQNEVSYKHIISIPEHKTEISQWFASLPEKPSGRLCKLLLDYRWADDGKPFKYVEDVNKFEFMGLRDAGKRSWAEFCELRGIINDWF